MGKKTRAATAERERPAEAAALPTLTALVSAVLTPVVLILLIASLDRSEFLYSKKEGRCHFITRLFIWMFLQESVTRALAEVLMPAARRIARFLPGESRPITAQEESEQHDPSLKWPCAGTELPPEWTAAARGKQPYFLNHVRGSVRFRQALLRVAAATGSIVQVFAMAWLIDRRPPEAIGLTLAWVDVALGVFTGVSVIVLLFCAEVALGWLRIVGYFEVVSPNESLHVNLLWSVRPIHPDRDPPQLQPQRHSSLQPHRRLPDHPRSILTALSHYPSSDAPHHCCPATPHHHHPRRLPAPRPSGTSSFTSAWPFMRRSRTAAGCSSTPPTRGSTISASRRRSRWRSPSPCRPSSLPWRTWARLAPRAPA